ncbi:MAG: ROK family protein [Gemmatimonadaceae bacterium]
MPVIGVDLGGTKLAGAAFSDDGGILNRHTTAVRGKAGQDVATLVIEQVRALRSGPAQNASAVGVSVPGIYHADHGTVWAPNIPGWDDFPLRETLERAFPEMRVVIDSDRAAYIMGETWRGAAKGAKNAIFLAVGTGIGAGILVNGAILRGHGDIGGAIGWLALQRPYIKKWDACGCFEYQASGPGLVRIANDLLAEDRSYSGELRREAGREITTAELFAAHSRGDALATRVIDNAVELWGMTAANLVSLFNPETLIFGGGVFGPATSLLDRIRSEAEHWAQPIAIRQVTFAASILGGDAGLYGAGALAMQSPAPSLGSAASPSIV